MLTLKKVVLNFNAVGQSNLFVNDLGIHIRPSLNPLNKYNPFYINFIEMVCKILDTFQPYKFIPPFLILFSLVTFTFLHIGLSKPTIKKKIKINTFMVQ